MENSTKIQQICEACNEYHNIEDMHMFRFNGGIDYVCSNDHCIDMYTCDKFYCEGCGEYQSDQPGHIWDTPFYFISECEMVCSKCGEILFLNGSVEINHVESIGFKYLPVLPSYLSNDNRLQKFTKIMTTTRPTDDKEFDDFIKSIKSQITDDCDVDDYGITIIADESDYKQITVWTIMNEDYQKVNHLPDELSAGR